LLKNYPIVAVSDPWARLQRVPVVPMEVWQLHRPSTN
jgi:hypothetical protein